LYLLVTTEMWERMSFYGMRALLVLYIVDRSRGGLGWDSKAALQLYGLYTGLVYLTPLLGGFIADRFLGQRRTVLIGGVMMMVGHFLLAFHAVPFFFAGLAFLIGGNGLFKPNISTMVGGLYQPGDPRRDGAFTIFYMGINLGALLGPFVAGTLGEKVQWHYGFAAAGVGMGIGLALFVFRGPRLLGPIGLSPAARSKTSAEPSQSLSREDVHRIIVVITLSVFAVFFWMAFEQAGGLMNLYTESKVDRTIMGWQIPTTWFQSCEPIFIVLFGPVFAALWTGLAKRGKDLPIVVKMALGLLLVSVSFLFMLAAARETSGGGHAWMGWIVITYLLQAFGELSLSPVGLSMVTKLAPKRVASLLMGVWFGTYGGALYLAGFIGGLAKEWGESRVFLTLVIFSGLAGLLLLSLSGVLQRMMHGAADIRSEAEAVAAGEYKPGSASPPEITS
jgi:POT family proton-dependent oligopeptide transporter